MIVDIELKNAQTITPQLIQSVEILQMDTQELRQYIYQVYQENPLLEIEDEEPKATKNDLMLNKLDWLSSFRTQNARATIEDDDMEFDYYGSVYDERETLSLYLRYQLEQLDLTQEELQLATYVSFCLDNNGYLDDSVDRLAIEVNVPASSVANAVQIVQTLDPPGVCAQSLSECLSLQLARMGISGLPVSIVQSYLVELSKNKLGCIAKKLNVNICDVQDAASIIRSLNPRPGSLFDSKEETLYITPDLFLRSSANQIEVCSNDSLLPKLHFSDYYLSTLKNATDPELKEYLLGKVRQASWVMRCIEQRQSMMLKCASVIVEKQRDFLKYGFDHLKKLSLSDIAEIVGVHESTVSRAVKGKYIHCSMGTLPLSTFFSRALPGSPISSEDCVSTCLAKSVLRKLIDNEDKNNPLSDQKLSDLMVQQKAPISRRTIAKYRNELNILSAAGRKCV